MENMSGITDGNLNYEKCERSDWCIKKTGKWKVKLKISKTFNLWLKIVVFTIINCIFHFLVYLAVTRIALE